MKTQKLNLRSKEITIAERILIQIPHLLLNLIPQQFFAIEVITNTIL